MIVNMKLYSIEGMKIVREKKKEALKTISLQLPPSVLALADKAADEAEVSRQRLISLVLEQALTDPKFVLRVPD